MSKTGKVLFLTLLILGLVVSVLPAAASANSAEPPSLVILVNNSPKDLTVTLVSEGSQKDAEVKRAAWETYYIFYRRDLKAGDMYTFRIATKEESFESTIASLPKQYNNVYTLDLSGKELTPGINPLRSALLVSLQMY